MRRAVLVLAVVALLVIATQTGTADEVRSLVLPRNHRNNNPLNLRPLDGGKKWNGQTGVDPDGHGGGYAIFAATWQGWRAAGVNLLNYRKQGIKTVRGIVERWAPPTDFNDTPAYVAKVARDLKVDPDQAIDVRARLDDLLLSMARQEGGAWGDFDLERQAGVSAAKAAVK